MAAGGQGHVWVTDFLKLGLTASKNDGTGEKKHRVIATSLAAACASRRAMMASG